MEYFIADLHIGSNGIIKYCNRPFKSTKAMQNVIKENWNRVVKEGDTVYVVGDVFWGEKILRYQYKEYLNSLNGRKILIAGNHEENDFTFYTGDKGIGFEQMAYPFLEVEEFILLHDPVGSITLPHRPFITGHVHHMWHTLKNCYNCGVDVNDFTPVSIETIRKHFKESTWN